jgi:hypothetical protein
VVGFAPDTWGNSAAQAVTSDIAATAIQVGERSRRAPRRQRGGVRVARTAAVIVSVSPKRRSASSIA